MRAHLAYYYIIAGVALCLGTGCQAFVSKSAIQPSSSIAIRPHRNRPLRLFNNDEKDDATIEEEARLKIYENRRGQLRAGLKGAESLRSFRIEKGMYSTREKK
jgi:hypothetical protein